MRRVLWWSVVPIAAVLSVAGIMFVGSQGPTDCASEAGVRPKGPSRHCPTAAPSGDAGAISLDGRLDAALDASRRVIGAPGVQAAIVFPDGTTWMGAAGSSDEAVPVQDETLFAVGSITKPFVAALILDLVDEGKLELDSPVARWVPWLDGARSITVRQLLSHTSGLGEPLQGGWIDADPSSRWSARRTLAHLPRPACLPGRCWWYSNANYIVLGTIVEAVTGRRVQDELETRFLQPLGLDDVYLQSDVDPRGEIASGFERDFTEVLELPGGPGLTRSTATSASTAGAIVATASDVAGFFHALFEEGALSRRSLRAVTRPRVAGIHGYVPCHPYGLGIEASTSDAGELVWRHAGTMPGFRSEVVHFPGSGLTVVVATNLTAPGPGPSEVIGSLLTALREQRPRRSGPPAPCNTDVFAQRGRARAVRLTTHRAVDGGKVTSSPGDEQIVFGSARTGTPQLYVEDLATGITERVSPGVGPSGGASWSPDGSTIAYADASDGDGEIYLLDLASRKRTRLTDNAVPDSVPAWSPDGREIAFSRGIWGERDIWVIRADGRGERRLTTGREDEWWPAWSPDGREIAYVNESRGEIYALGSDGYDYRQLTNGKSPAAFPAWSRSGLIAFVEQGDVWTMRSDGSHRRRITSTRYREFVPGWSRDGETLFYAAERPRHRRAGLGR